MKVLFACLMLVGCLVGCVPAKHSYKITFEDGSVEYYELDYKPKENTKSIEYDNEVILGIDKVERID